MGNDREADQESCNPHSMALLVKDGQSKSGWMQVLAVLCCYIVFCIIVYLENWELFMHFVWKFLIKEDGIQNIDNV